LITLNDLEPPKYGVLKIFAIFRCGAPCKSELQRKGWR